MFDWKTLCQSLEIGSLVPDQFAEYRQPISDVLSFFLEGLSIPRQTRILADQAALPLPSPIEVRLVSVARHSPILHKLGQLLARDRRLSIDLRRLLQGLESTEPTISGSDARGIVEQELGNLNDLGLSIDDQPLAEASLAVVIPFTWRSDDTVRRGVFKILKPNIQEHLTEDLQRLTEAGTFLDDRCGQYGIPNIDYQGIFAQVRDLLGNEVDLHREQEHMQMARQSFAESPEIVVPELFPFCTARVTAMERIDGRKITQLAGQTAPERRRIARRLIDALIAQPIWSTQESALFHADPHAGNLLLTDDHRLAILDWGLAGRLTKQERVHVTQILIGAVTLDARSIVQAIRALSDDRLDGRALTMVVDDALRSVRRGKFPGNGWLTAMMDDAVTRAQVSFPSDLLLFRKSLLILEGVIADISEDCTTDNVLAVSFVMQLGGEWRKRLLTPPLARGTSTHLSNADLLKLMSSGPTTTVRFWRGLFQDLLKQIAA